MPIASLTSELRAAARAGSGPHLVILQSHTIGTLAEENVLLPLDDVLTASAPLDHLLPTAVSASEAYDSEGTVHLYGLPLTFDTLALYYRTVDLDTPPADMETLLTTAHDLTDVTAQPPVWGLAYTLSLDKTIGYLYAFGGRIFDDEGNLVLGSTGRAGTERWLNWLTTLRQDEHVLAVPVSDSIAVDSTLRAQTALMTIDWAHALPRYTVLWGDTLGVHPLPHVGTTAAAPQPYVQSDVLTINARVVDTAEQQAALDFMNYLLSEESQRALLEGGKQPTLLQLDLNGDTQELEVARVFREQALQGRAIPNSPIVNTIVREELERMQVAVLRGLSSPAEAVTHTDAVLQERLSQHTIQQEMQQ
jgi:maltose-binding protein MalE